ncbi:MAG: hypothetical protein PUK70_04435 [Bacteroidales bacterium]|nr:hypothetical protein [Bacteroidales bacterium]MDY6001641.1 hypothetical protein [Candidatus Cryptobacteroides sp.]
MIILKTYKYTKKQRKNVMILFEYMLPAIGASVMVSGSSIGTVTDNSA